MPLWALTTLFLWRASTRGGLGNWLLLGLFGGLSMWAKYSSAMLLIPAAAWILWDAEARKRLLSIGPYLALAVFALVIAPQALWLLDHQFQPFAYAARRSGEGGFVAAVEFLATQVADHLPLAILLLAAGFFGKAVPDATQRPEQRAWRFLLLMGFGPLALTALAGVFGAGLRASWAAPMFNLSGLIVIALLSHKFSTARLGRLAWGAGVLIVLVSGLYFAHMKYGARFTNDPLRGNWPQRELSLALEGAWVTETDAPLEIVAGDIWTAGLVGLQGRNPPSVLINGDYAISPWVSPLEAARSGMLIVWRADEAPAPRLAALAEGLDVRTLELRYPDFPEAPPLVINYAIAPPGAATR
jgi:4-amino-4-deoxy-L-arabinose transferase-like glycosyltransferase